jgi:dynein heavy chain
MSMVNPMYQVSLDQFLGKFKESIVQAAESASAKTRVANIINTLNDLCWAYMVRGLCEKDKLLFRLQLALKIDMSLPPEKNGVDASDYQTFIKAGAMLSAGSAANMDEPLGDVFEPVRDNIISLSALNSHRGFITHISGAPSEWAKLMSSSALEEDPLPNFGQMKPEEVKPFTNA